MDILSDINVVGNLTVENSSPKVVLKATSNGNSSEFIIGTDGKVITIDYFKTPGIRITSEFCFETKYSSSKYNNHYIFGKTYKSIIPVNCSKFYIDQFEVGTPFELNQDIIERAMVYPITQVFCNNKKVEVDIEFSYSFGDAKRGWFSEFIIGSIQPCSSERTMTFAVSPTFVQGSWSC